jgi:hypothetical protein
LVNFVMVSVTGASLHALSFIENEASSHCFALVDHGRIRPVR